MIPKVIHYCWFGRGEKSHLIRKCIKSWKKYCPDYEIIEWNEDNFDIESIPWTKQAYECKKWAFVADYVRLKVLYDYGGIYLDTDQELLKSFDPFLNDGAFLGFMTDKTTSMGVIGTEKENEIIKSFLEYYEDKKFSEFNEALRTNTDIFNERMANLGLQPEDIKQVIQGVTVYPATYFCPTSCITVENCITKDTVSIHHWAMTWRTEEGKKDLKCLKRHSMHLYKIYEQIAAYPIALYRKIFVSKKR